MTNASPLAVEDFNHIPIKTVGNTTIYMRDVADVFLSGPPQTNSVLVDGKRAVMIVVMKSGGASTLAVVDGIKKALPRIQKIVPGGVGVKILNDASVFVKDSIKDVLHEMVLATALTGLVVLLFLGSWRATTIIATSIPLSILSSIICLNWMGESINVMTLGGLALAVGILVDDATVMIEIIDTHMEMGKPLDTAIIEAANQIVIPTFVATPAIVIVWFPLFELSGVSGWLFLPMAEAVVFAMLASFILSRTLVPTMVKFILKDHNAPHAHQPGTSAADRDAEKAYALANWDSEIEALQNIGGTHFAEAVPDPELEAEKSRTLFGRTQQSFEHGFNRFRDRYDELLAQAVAHRREFFPEIKSGTLQMHMRARLGTRIEVAGRIASLVADDIRKLLPG